KVDIETIMPFSKLPRDFDGEPTHTVIDEEQLRVENELLSSHGATVLLTGHGGDQVLCGSPGRTPTHLADRLFTGDFRKALRDLKIWKDGVQERRSYSYWIVRGLLEPTLDHVRGHDISHPRRRRPFPSWLTAAYISQMRLDQRGRRRLATRCARPGLQAQWDAIWLSSMAMATVPLHRMNFDLRTPLLYRPLVEFMLSIPWDH